MDSKTMPFSFSNRYVLEILHIARALRLNLSSAYSVSCSGVVRLCLFCSKRSRLPSLRFAGRSEIIRFNVKNSPMSGPGLSDDERTDGPLTRLTALVIRLFFLLPIRGKHRERERVCVCQAKAFLSFLPRSRSPKPILGKGREIFFLSSRPALRQASLLHHSHWDPQTWTSLASLAGKLKTHHCVMLHCCRMRRIGHE